MAAPLPPPSLSIDFAKQQAASPVLCLEFLGLSSHKSTGASDAFLIIHKVDNVTQARIRTRIHDREFQEAVVMKSSSQG